MRKLEECFGTELVRHQGRGLVLTAFGDPAGTFQNALVRISLTTSGSLLQRPALPRLPALQKAQVRVVGHWGR